MSDALVQAASPRRLLVVDDNPVNRKLAVAFVQRLGWQVEQAEAGAEALRLLAARPFDMVLLDISMPQMSGEEVLAHIRQTPALAGLRVVAWMRRSNDGQWLRWQSAPFRTQAAWITAWEDAVR